MSEPKQLPVAILVHIAGELKISIHNLVATIQLLDEGGTIPFIARYRKEATGNLDEVVVAAIQERTNYFRDMEDRRATILSSIAEQGKLTPDLKAKIESVLDRNQLEDLYLPYKPKRRTKATIARERGLEPLAEYIVNQIPAGQTLHELAASLVNPEKEINTPEEALEGARHILAEQFSENAEYRAYLRQLMLSEGMVVSRAVENANDPEGKFKMYFEYSEPASKIPSHRMLAIRRGANENILYFQIELDPLKPVAYLKKKIIRQPGDWVPQLEIAAEDSWKRLLNLSIQTEVRLELKQRSDAEAIRVFRENLGNLLLSPPAGSLSVLGVDPGIRTGCKLAVVDETGKPARSHRHVPARTAQRYCRFPQNHGRPHRQTQSARHLHRQRNRFARSLGLHPGLPPRPETLNRLQRRRQRIRRLRLLRFRNCPPGISGSRSNRPRRYIHRPPSAGPACRTGQDRSEIHRRWPIPARRRSAQT